jgi:hypothetical protein
LVLGQTPIRQNHVRPKHVRPKHVRPKHVRPNHNRPNHVRPNHVRPNHVRQNKVVPNNSAFQWLKSLKPYIPAGLELTIFCSVGGYGDHYTTPPGHRCRYNCKDLYIYFRNFKVIYIFSQSPYILTYLPTKDTSKEFQIKFYLTAMVGFP